MTWTNDAYQNEVKTHFPAVQYFRIINENKSQKKYNVAPHLSFTVICSTITNFFFKYEIDKIRDSLSFLFICVVHLYTI